MKFDDSRSVGGVKTKNNLRAQSRWRIINTLASPLRSEVKLSAEHSGRMMAQHVGCLRFVPATILLLLVPVFVGQLANVNASTTTNYSAVGHDSDDVLPRVQFAVQSARVITTDTLALSALPLGISSSDQHLLVEFLGTDLSRSLALRWSSSSQVCPEDSNNTLDAVWISPTNNRVIYKFRTVPNAGVTTIYLCLKNNSIADEKWSNIGDYVAIKFRAG